MSTSKPPQQPNNFVDQAAQATDHGIHAAQDIANEKLDSLAGTVEEVRKQAGPFLNQASEQASALAQHGVDIVRDGAQHLRDRARRTADFTVSYVKDKPIKAILIATAAGAALMALISTIMHSRNRP